MRILKQQSGISQQQLNNLQQIIIDPILGLPECKKSNQGQFCGSLLQIFLSSSHQNNKWQTVQFPHLQQIMQNQYQNFLRQFLELKQIDNIQAKQTIIKLRLHPQSINSQTQQLNSLILPGNKLHNMVTGLMGFLSIYLQLTYLYLISIQQPICQLVEIVLRWNIYRNMILSVEQNLSFLFCHYNQLFKDVFNLEMEDLQFSKIAIKKWQQVFQKLQPKINSTYLKIYNATYFKNQLELINQPTNQMCEYLNRNYDQIQIILTQYVEFVVDLSTNSNNVQWFGHSQQQLGEPYCILQEKFIDMVVANQKITNQQQMDALGQRLQSNHIKPLTISKIIRTIQESATYEWKFKQFYQQQDSRIEGYNLKHSINQKKQSNSQETTYSINEYNSEQLSEQNYLQYISQGQQQQLTENDLSIQIETQI